MLTNRIAGEIKRGVGVLRVLERQSLLSHNDAQPLTRTFMTVISTKAAESAIDPLELRRCLGSFVTGVTVMTVLDAHARLRPSLSA